MCLAKYATIANLLKKNKGVQNKRDQNKINTIDCVFKLHKDKCFVEWKQKTYIYNDGKTYETRGRSVKWMWTG